MKTDSIPGMGGFYGPEGVSQSQRALARSGVSGGEPAPCFFVGVYESGMLGLGAVGVWVCHKLWFGCATSYGLRVAQAMVWV
jgi:hypothetical protein